MLVGMYFLCRFDLSRCDSSVFFFGVGVGPGRGFLFRQFLLPWCQAVNPKRMPAHLKLTRGHVTSMWQRDGRA